MSNALPRLKDKGVDELTELLEKTREILMQKGELTEEEVQDLERDVEWIMYESGINFREEKRDTVNKGFSFLRKDQSVDTALGIIKTVKREIEPRKV